MSRLVIARARFFTGSGIERRRCKLDEDGTVRVWDKVAGHYTLVHSLSPSARRRISRLVREARS